MIETDLFEFAYVPDWYGQLEQLAEMALPEAWRFRKPQTECKNTDTPILERYLHMMFRKLSIDYNTGETAYFHVEKQLCLLSYRTVHKTISGNLCLL